MDEFTETTLKNWGFENLIYHFKEEEIDMVAFLGLTESMIAKFLPKMGHQSKFNGLLVSLREKIKQDKETYSLISDEQMTLTSSDSIDISNLSFIISSDELHPTFIDKTENIHVESSSKNICTTGDDDLATLMLLPYMFQPTNVAIKNKKTYRPSKIEQSRSFITHISNANELKTLHKQKVDGAFNLDLTVQPYAVIVGDIDGLEPLHSYVIINNTQYLLETPIKAIDICFKAFHSLNLEYPLQSSQVWCFIEQYFFGIVNPTKGKQFLSIQTLVKDLQPYSGTSAEPI